MTHLYIEQATDRTEEVNSSIISKLYELAISGDLDNTSDLLGRLHSTLGYDTEVTYLNEHFSDLHISVDKALLPFKEKWIADKIVTYLGSLGNNGTDLTRLIVADEGFTRETATLLPVLYGINIQASLTKAEWRTVKYFNEYAYFTNYHGINTSYVEFRDLIEIDCSNVTSFSTYGTNFNNCSELTKCTLNPNIVTTLEGSVFFNCSKLNFDVYLPNNTGNCEESFRGSAIEKILNPGPGFKLSGDGPYGRSGFRNCKSLKYVSIPYNAVSERNISNGNTDNGYIFCNCNALECVIFNCQSVFTLGNTNHFNGGTNANFKVYVPDSLVNDYKADTYWSTWSSHIFGISLLQTDNAEYYQLWQDYTDHSAEPSNT